MSAWLVDHDETPRDDKIIVLHGATWADYQRILELRGESSAPRLAYLDGALEIMSPSRFHESIHFMIGRLVEVWCLEVGVEFSGYGSWTLEKKEDRRGVEPDACYVFGTNSDPERPDLAIEVVWTSGGVDKLAIYVALRVREVWFWRSGRLSVHMLRDGAYEEVAASEVLPGIDLVELAQFIVRPTASQAIREYQSALQARGVHGP